MDDSQKSIVVGIHTQSHEVQVEDTDSLNSGGSI